MDNWEVGSMVIAAAMILGWIIFIIIPMLIDKIRNKRK